MPRARWTMIFLCCLANTINYIDRANLAVAAPTMQRELGIDAAMIGLILGGFFWTYSVMQMPFGWFADRVGAKYGGANLREMDQPGESRVVVTIEPTKVYALALG